ncbi:unnamed protein product [Caenorhabditis brenneri]
MQNLKDSIKNNPVHLRILIQFEVLQKKTLPDAFKSFCGVFGDDFMEYKEFKDFYYRFCHGDIGLENNWDQERVERNQLYGLPVKVLDSILNELDEQSKIAARQVSTKIRDFIHPVKPTITTPIVVRGTLDSINVTFNGNLYRFLLNNEDHTERMSARQEVEVAVKKFKNLLRTRLDSEFIDLDLNLSWGLNSSQWFLEGIRNVPYQIKNLKVQIGNTQCIVDFLKTLSGPLEKIELDSFEQLYFVKDDFLDMQIIKSAKSLTLPWLGLFLPSDLERFHRFEEFRCRLNFISMDALIKLRESCRTSSSFKRCVIHTSERYPNSDEIKKAFGMKIEEKEECRICEQIPNSDDILEWTFNKRTKSIYIEKVRTWN